MNETIEEKKKILNTYGAAVRKYHALKNQEEAFKNDNQQAKSCSVVRDAIK